MGSKMEVKQKILQAIAENKQLGKYEWVEHRKVYSAKEYEYGISRQRKRKFEPCGVFYFNVRKEDLIKAVTDDAVQQYLDDVKEYNTDMRLYKQALAEYKTAREKITKRNDLILAIVHEIEKTKDFKKLERLKNVDCFWKGDVEKTRAELNGRLEVKFEKMYQDRRTPDMPEHFQWHFIDWVVNPSIYCLTIDYPKDVREPTKPTEFIFNDVPIKSKYVKFHKENKVTDCFPPEIFLDFEKLNRK